MKATKKHALKKGAKCLLSIDAVIRVTSWDEQNLAKNSKVPTHALSKCLHIVPPKTGGRYFDITSSDFVDWQQRIAAQRASKREPIKMLDPLDYFKRIEACKDWSGGVPATLAALAVESKKIEIDNGGGFSGQSIEELLTRPKGDIDKFKTIIEAQLKLQKLKQESGELISMEVLSAIVSQWNSSIERLFDVGDTLVESIIKLDRADREKSENLGLELYKRQVGGILKASREGVEKKIKTMIKGDDEFI